MVLDVVFSLFKIGCWLIENVLFSMSFTTSFFYKVEKN